MEKLGWKKRQDNRSSDDDEDSNPHKWQQKGKKCKKRGKNRKCKNKHNANDGKDKQCEQQITNKI